MKAIKISKFMLYLAIPTLIVFLLVVSLWIFPLFWLGLIEQCSESITDRVAISNYTAEKLVKNCGATSDFATQVLITNNSTKYKEKVLSLKGDQSNKCVVMWMTESLLNINCVGNLDIVYNKQSNFENVTINFLVNGVQYNE